MKTSVVISTYNGEKYILEQLDSIRTQTLTVDEVLIFDDRSHDNTVELCRDFINKFNLENWKVLNNEKNKGFVKNFIDGLYETTGDIIFLADQDDIWCRNKVELTLNIFRKKKCLSLASTFSRFDINNKCVDSHVKHPNRKKNGLKQITLDDYCHFNAYLGMATAISRNLMIKYDLRKFCNHFKSHDIMINYVAVINRGLYFYDYPLVARRSYYGSTSNSQIIDAVEKLNGNSLLFNCQTDLSWYRSYLEIKIEDDQQNRLISRYIHLHSRRLDYLKNLSIKRFLLNYRLLFSKIRLRYVKDLFGLLRLKNK